MNFLIHRARFILAILLCIAQLAHGQSTTHKITVRLDPQKTEIHWTLGGTLHTVYGTFRLKSGLMAFNPSSGMAEGEFLVDSNTGESENILRDRKMKNEVLESGKYPQVFFHPIKVSGELKTGDPQNITVTGTLNIHGADHPLTLQMIVRINGTDATATTQFTIPYVSWGMKDPSAFLLKVDKEVAVTITGRGTIEDLSSDR